jgi:hypothetical protein
MAKVKIFNVCGRPLDSETKDGPVRIMPGDPITLDSPMKIGQKMKEQIDSKLLKQQTVVENKTPYPTSIDQEAMEKEAKKKAKLREKSNKAKAKAKKATAKEKPIPAPPADDDKPDPPAKKNPYEGLKGDKLITAVMKDMIDKKDNLGSDGKPNQPVLEQRVKEISPKAKVSARKRDKLYKKLMK